ncbi:MAG: glycosyltransferase family 4 protein [Bacteroides sp.]|nr:glycosyltransferase family 4 protein [Bacteroides sp.]
MKILLFRSNNIFASRVNKYVNYYKRLELDYTIIGWDREGEAKLVEHYDFCKYKASTNVGGIKAMIAHTKWMWFVFKYLMNHKDVTTIHACDLNVAFPAALFKMLFKREVILIFDVCDWFSANFSKYSKLCKVLNVMEKFACKQANYIIICEPERKAQIQFSIDKEPLVLPNIPEIDNNYIFEKENKYSFNNDKITIAYFGGFSNDRFLTELLDLTKNSTFNLLIAGYGSKDIENKCRDLEKMENVKFFGRLDMKEGLQMSYNADIIYMMYCKSNMNHIYAAPNKYYEALFLGKPLITTKGIIVENKVHKNDIGYSVEENIDELNELILSLNKMELENKGKNAKKLWDDVYCRYVNDFFENIYSKIIH